MLKIKNDAVKTMASALNEIKTSASQPSDQSSEVIELNQKLYEIFGISVRPKSAPAPQSKPIAVIPTPPPIMPAPATLAPTDEKQEEASREKQRIAQMEATKKQLERQKLAAQKTAEEEQKRKEEEEREKAEEEQKRKEEERKRIEEEQKKKEEEQTKKIEEQKKREEQRRAAQEKIRLEKARFEEEKKKTHLEKQRRLAALEEEREKSLQKETQHQPQEIIDRGKPLGQEEPTEPKNIYDAMEELIKRITIKERDLEKELTVLPETKTPLEKQKLVLEGKTAFIKSNELSVIEAHEKEIERQGAVEKAKLGRKLSPQQEKIVEQKLWAIEEQRREIEKQRWEIEDRISKIITQAQAIEDQIKQKVGQEEAIRQEIKNIAGQVNLTKFAIDKCKSEEEILKIIEEKDGLTPSLEKVNGKKNAIDAALEQLSQEETSAKNKLNEIEQQEKQAADAAQKRAAEQERWRASNALKKTIQKKWEKQEELKQIASEAQSLQEKINAINGKIAKIQNKISANEIALEKEGLAAKKIRDSIAALFKENNITFDQDFLADIIQVEDKPLAEDKIQSMGKPAASNQAEVKPNIQQSIPTPRQQQPLPRPASEKSESPRQTEPTKPTEPKISIADEITPQKKDASEQTDAPGKKMPDDNNANDQSNIKTPPSQAIAGTDTIGQVVKKLSEVKSAQTIPVYRETVEAAESASKIKIREFPEIISSQKNEAENVEPTELAAQKKPTAKTATTKTEENLTIGMEKPMDSDMWGNRWEQMKKTTAPTVATITAGKPAPVVTPAMQTSLPETEEIIYKNKEGSKFLIRVFVILLLLGIIGVFLAFILIKNNAPASTKKPTSQSPTAISPNEKTKSETSPENNEEKTTEKEKSKQVSDLSVISTIPIYTEDLASVPSLILPYLQTSLGTNGYCRVSIQNKKDNTLVGLRQFFNIYKINAPSSFYSSVNDDFTLFIYSNSGKSRLGFVSAVINLNSLNSAISTWKTTIKQDTDNLFRSIGRKTQDAQKNYPFETKTTPSGAKYQSMAFLPASDNFSLNLAIYNDKYFIFTTSADSMSKIFDQLPK